MTAVEILRHFHTFLCRKIVVLSYWVALLIVVVRLSAWRVADGNARELHREQVAVVRQWRSPRGAVSVDDRPWFRLRQRTAVCRRVSGGLQRQLYGVHVSQAARWPLHGNHSLRDWLCASDIALWWCRYFSCLTVYITLRISVILYKTCLLGVGVLNLSCCLVITQSLTFCVLQFKFKTPTR